MIDFSTSNRFVDMSPILIGASNTKKYKCVDSSGQSFFLKAEEVKNPQSFQLFCDMINGLPPFIAPQLIEHGFCNEGAYVLHEWIDGDILQNTFANMGKNVQYKFGLLAADILKKIHRCKPIIGKDAHKDSWGDRYSNIAIRTAYDFISSPNRFYGDNKYLIWLKNSKKLFKERNVSDVFCHFDFSPRNIMVNNDGELRVVDFGSLDKSRRQGGDPYIDFKCIRHGVEHPHFYSGFINGYFGTSPPPIFWRFISLYISLIIFKALNTSVKSKKWSSVKLRVDRAKRYLMTIPEDNSFIPTWYIPPLSQEL